MPRPRPSQELLTRYVETVARGASMREAAIAVGRTPKTCQLWVRQDAAFAERLRAARHAGKARLKARRSAQMRAAMSAVVGRQDAPAAETVVHSGPEVQRVPVTEPRPASRRIPIGRLDDDNILWADEALLRLVVAEMAKAITNA